MTAAAHHRSPTCEYVEPRGRRRAKLTGLHPGAVVTLCTASREWVVQEIQGMLVTLTPARRDRWLQDLTAHAAHVEVVKPGIPAPAHLTTKVSEIQETLF